MYKIYILKILVLVYGQLIHKSIAENLSLPDGFLIGAASSSYQVEGAWNVSCKAENIWDYITHHHPDIVADKSNGDVACDFYHKYKDDIKLAKDIGLNHFRFSLSWSRILPTGYANKSCPDGIRYYHSILDELEKHGIIPFVTIYHWDHPQTIEEMGGWLNEKMIYLFKDYAKFVFKEFGHRVKFWTTINEPIVLCEQGYAMNMSAPGVYRPGVGEYQCVHNMLKAHALAYHTYDDNFRRHQKGQIGIVIPCFYFYPKNKGDTESPEIAFAFQCGWNANPIFSKKGDYPEIMKQRIAERSKLQGLHKSRLPKFSKKWVKYIRGSSDYFGLNHYTSSVVEPLDKNDILNWPKDDGLQYSLDPNWESTQSVWLRIVPQGLGDLLRAIKTKYNNPPVYILESGMGDGNSTNDNLRIKYYYLYMREMLKAMNEDKCDVRAFTIWSFLDSFEWNRGYLEQFGIIEVDFKDKDLKRTPKKSASWFRKLGQTRALPAPNEY